MAPCQNATQGKKIAHNTHQTSQVLASELSLAAFILLLITVFSKKWLCLSGSRFYQRWPANISASIHLSAHIMTMGPLQICSSRSCFNLENGKLHGPEIEPGLPARQRLRQKLVEVPCSAARGDIEGFN